MRVYSGLLAVVLVGVARALPQGAGTPNSARNFGDLLDGDGESFLTYVSYLGPVSRNSTQHDLKATHVPETALSGLLAGITSIVDPSRIASASISAYTTVTTSNVAFSLLAAPLVSTHTSERAPIPTENGSQSVTANQLSNGSRTWKIIGVSLIVVTFVASSIIIVVFFDDWWRFLRDLVLGNSKAPDFEDLVPDWQKRTWEVRLAEEEGHRYPSMASDLGLSRQPSAVQRLDDDSVRYPFPNRCAPQSTGVGIGLGLSSDHYPTTQASYC